MKTLAKTIKGELVGYDVSVTVYGTTWEGFECSLDLNRFTTFNTDHAGLIDEIRSFTKNKGGYDFQYLNYAKAQLIGLYEDECGCITRSGCMFKKVTLNVTWKGGELK